MALTDYLTTQNADPMLDVDPKWKLFVIDHKAYIINNSSMVQISSQIMGQCNYNLKRYLRQQSLQVSLVWVILLINNMSSEMDFNFSIVNQNLYFPSEDLMQSLYLTYQTTSLLKT